MKNLILQHFDGEMGELEKRSVENIKEYAKMVGAEYQLITGKPFRKHLTAPCQKVYMIDEVWDEYDTIVMLDIDMFAPKGMTKNIFEDPGIGLYSDTQKMLHNKIVRTYPLISSLQSPYWGGAIYKLDKPTRKKLRAELGGNEAWMQNYNKRYNFGDEGIMHTLAVKAGIKVKKNAVYLDKRWCQCSFLPNPEKAYFIHVRTKITPTGPKQEKIKNYQALVSKGIL